jgi:outer membrane lipoprotein SlyB
VLGGFGLELLGEIGAGDRGGFVGFDLLGGRGLEIGAAGGGVSWGLIIKDLERVRTAI